MWQTPEKNHAPAFRKSKQRLYRSIYSPGYRPPLQSERKLRKARAPGVCEIEHRSRKLPDFALQLAIARGFFGLFLGNDSERLRCSFHGD